MESNDSPVFTFCVQRSWETTISLLSLSSLRGHGKQPYPCFHFLRSEVMESNDSPAFTFCVLRSWETTISPLSLSSLRDHGKQPYPWRSWRATITLLSLYAVRDHGKQPYPCFHFMRSEIMVNNHIPAFTFCVLRS